METDTHAKHRCDPASKHFLKDIYSAALREDEKRITEMIREYKSHFSKINGKTVLHYACSKGHTSLVRLLVTKYSCDLNARDSNGDSPFTCAGLGGSVECVEPEIIYSY